MRLMEKIKQRKKPKYVKEQSILEEIQSSFIPTFDRYLFRNYMYYTQFKEDYHTMEHFTLMTKIPIGEIRKLDIEAKKEIRNCIFKRIESIRMIPEQFPLFYGEDAYPIENRIRFLVKGKNVEGICWLTKEKQKEIHKKLVDFAMVEFDQVLQLKEDIQMEKAVLALDIALLDKKIPHMDNFIIESEIEKMVKLENEREQLKQIIRNWYRNTKQTFVQDTLDWEEKNTHIRHIEELLYLMTPEQKQQVKEIWKPIIKNEIKKAINLYEVEQLERKLEKVLTW